VKVSPSTALSGTASPSTAANEAYRDAQKKLQSAAKTTYRRLYQHYRSNADVRYPAPCPLRPLEADVSPKPGKVSIFGQDTIVGITQGWKLTGAIKTAERKLADGKLCHAGQRLMSWCVGYARVEPKGNAIAITKQASGTAKIDPLMAAFNAIALMSTNPWSTRRGLFII
jgi:hypothetical protein